MGVTVVSEPPISIRLPPRFEAWTKWFIDRHPRTLSKTQIFIAGLKAVAEAAMNQGEKLPDDIFADLESEIDQRMEVLKKEREEVTELRMKNQQTAKTTTAPKTSEDGCREGHHWETIKDERGNPVKIAVENPD